MNTPGYNYERSTVASRRQKELANQKGILSKQLHPKNDPETGEFLGFVLHRGDGRTHNVGATKRKQEAWDLAVARSKARRAAKKANGGKRFHLHVHEIVRTA